MTVPSMLVPSMPVPFAIGLLLVAATCQLGACAAVPGDPPSMTTQPDARAAQGGAHRFIVKFRDGSAPSERKEAVQPRLDAKAPEGVALSWQRRLGVQADLFTTSRLLDAREAAALMQRFRDDPDVEYIEADGRSGIDPIRADMRN